MLINGQNFWLNFEGKPRKTGFNTTRFVQAKNPDEAINLAVKLIREDSALSADVLNEPHDPPILYTEGIEEADMVHPAGGFTFYPEE